VACGRDLAEAIALEPIVASARLDRDQWRITVSTTSGPLGLIVRQDREVIEAAMIGPGGTEALPRDERLKIFERGC
jgi:hypothetical protein